MNRPYLLNDRLIGVVKSSDMTIIVSWKSYKSALSRKTARSLSKSREHLYLLMNLFFMALQIWSLSYKNLHKLSINSCS
jgi:hypothetical protein